MALLASATFLVSCANGSMVDARPDLTVLSRDSLPQPSAYASASRVTAYTIGPLDQLTVSVFGLEELSLPEIRVDQNGNIAVPLAGTFRAAGLSPAELGARIEAALSSKQVRNPSVAVNVLEIKSRNVTIEGEVELPGIFPVETDLTLLRAVALARGPSEFARTSEILVFRTVEGQDYVGVYDLNALRAGTYEDPAIYPDDLVVVGDSPSRRAFRTLVQGAALLSPLVILLR
jgi:polysaccharide export outer membrane protein